MDWSRFGMRDVVEARRMQPFLLVTPAVAMMLGGFAEASGSDLIGVVPTTGDVSANLFGMLGFPALLVLAAWALYRVPPDWVCGCLVLVILGGFLGTLALNVGFEDSSSGGWMFYVVPLIGGGYLLRPLGAAVMTVLACNCAVAQAYLVDTSHRAGVESLFFTVVAVTITTVLVKAREQQSAVEEELRAASTTDALTGLTTRQVFDEVVLGAVEPLAAGEQGGVIIVDVDYFKQINDKYGHPVGDETLIQVAALLRDTAQDGELICRLGGDELVLFIRGCSAQETQARAELIAELAASVVVPTPKGPIAGVSLSVGAAHGPTHAPSLRDLFSVADEALYEVKRDGRGRAQMGLSEGAVAQAVIPAPSVVATWVP